MNHWQSLYRLPEGTPSLVISVIALLSIYALVLTPSAYFFHYISRKLAADLQARVGPSRAGKAGIFQPLADWLKLLQKRSSLSWKWDESLWFYMHAMALFSTVAILPIGSKLILVDRPLSALLPFWSASIFGFSLLLFGLSRDSVVSWLSGVRIASQMISGFFPAWVALLSIGIHAGSFKWSALVAAQGAYPWEWSIFSNPFQWISFSVFMMGGLTAFSIPPMATSGIDSLSEQFSGPVLSFFKFGRFYAFFLWSLISVVLFLGAWNLSEDWTARWLGGEYESWLPLVELSWLLFKTLILMLLIHWISIALPRSRVDQVTDFAWKVLSPLALFSLIASSLWGYFW